MDPTDQPRTDNSHSPVSREESVAAFAQELNSVICQLELASRADRPIGEIADQVHRLRERAERLFDQAD